MLRISSLGSMCVSTPSTSKPLARVAMVAVIVSLAMPTAASADIVVADQSAFGGSGGVIRVDPATGARTTVSENASPPGGPSFVDPSDVVLAKNGDMLVVDPAAFAGAGGGVIRVNAVTGARTTLSENSSPSGGPSFVDPFGIALAANGDLLVADQNAFGGGGGVIRVDPVSGARTTVTENATPPGAPAFDAPWGIIEVANGDILIADAGAFGGGGGVIRVNPATGARTTLSANGIPAGGPNFSDPIQLALAANGDVLVTDSGLRDGGRVIRVDPATGARTTVSENTSPPGDPAFASPIGITIASNGDILVSGFTNGGPGGGITRVNPQTGARTTVSENPSPSGGPSFAFPSGIEVEPDPAAPDTAAPETTITAGPSGETDDRTPTFSFTSSEPGSRFACAADGVPLLLCSSPFTTLRLAPGQHRFEVAATDPAGNADRSPARRDFRVLANLQDLPPPVLGRSVNVDPVSGTVLVATPPRSSSSGRARHAQKGLTFVPLREARQIPLGSFFNTRRGRVRIQTATQTRGKRQAGDFFNGLFQVLQSRKRSAKGLTELRLKGSSFRRCKTSARPKRRRGRATMPAQTSASRTIRRLGSSAKGRFRTRGRHSAATVRGTKWTTTDRCDGTLTKVTRGKVAVRDFRRRKTIIVKAGRSYLAKARR